MHNALIDMTFFLVHIHTTVKYNNTECWCSMLVIISFPLCYLSMQTHRRENIH